MLGRIILRYWEFMFERKFDFILRLGRVFIESNLFNKLREMGGGGCV